MCTFSLIGSAIKGEFDCEEMTLGRCACARTHSHAFELTNQLGTTGEQCTCEVCELRSVFYVRGKIARFCTHKYLVGENSYGHVAMS